jgi:hypothetical protein
VVPAGIILGEVELGETLNAKPLQVWVVIFAIEGRGFTVTTITNGKPTHVLDVGIMVYVTVPTRAGFISVKA